MPAGPLAALHELGAGHHAPRAGEDERPRQIGRRVGEDVGRVGDLDAAQLGGDDVHIVVPHGSVGDDLELGELLELGADCAGGHDKVDVVAAELRGVKVTNTPNVLTDAT